MLIKPGITADGFRTAVRDYTEPTVVEELAANSYDADAATLLVLLDPDQGHLYLIDDGIGFTRDWFLTIATLGAGDKRDIPYSKGKRHYLGSYGYGLKSTLNIASKIEIDSFTAKEHLTATVDWNQLEDALKPDFDGFPYNVVAKKTI
jgi:HSP90 family molecular chaperone